MTFQMPQKKIKWNNEKILDWTELELSEEEVELIQSVENGEWQSVPDIEKRKNELKNSSYFKIENQ